MNRPVVTLVALASLLSACGKNDEDQPAGGEDSGTEPIGEGQLSTLPNPALVIAVGGDSKVSIVDPITLAVVSSAAVDPGMYPHHLGISPDRSSVLLTATSADLSMGHGSAHAGTGGHGASASTMIYLLDVAQRTLQDVITVEATAHNAAFTRDGSVIVLGMMEHGMIMGYDAGDFSETFSATGFDMPLEVTPTESGDLLVAESGSGQVAIFDLDTQTVTSRVDVGAVPVAAWASGGNDYFVSVEEDMKVRHLVEQSAGIELDSHVLDPGGMPGQAILTPNGEELWLAVEDRGVVVVFDATTHDQLAEFEAGTSPHGIAFEPDGSRAFVTDQGSNNLLVVDVPTRTITSNVEVGAKPNGIVWLEEP